MSDKPLVTIEDGKVFYRASGLGLGIQALVAARQEMAPLPPSDDALVRFADGHMHEEAVLKRMRDEGWEIVDEQREIIIPITTNVFVRGHIDGIFRHPDLCPKPFVGDVKSMAKDPYAKWIKNRWEGAAPYVQGYRLQIGAYGYALDLLGMVIAKNKDSGVIDYYYFDKYEFKIGEVIKKIVTVENHFKNGDDVMTIECTGDWFCPYRHLHPQKSNAVDDENVNVEKIDKLMGLYLEAGERETEAKKDKASYRDELDSLVLDDTKVSGLNGTITKITKTKNTFDTKAFKEANPDVNLEPYMMESKFTEIKVTKPKKGK